MADTMDASNLTLAIIGCGAMGSAILSGVLDSCAKLLENGADDAPMSKFIACVHSKASAEKLETRFQRHAERLQIIYGDNHVSSMQKADVILLACKPYMASKVLGMDGVRDAVKGKLIISVLAGSTQSQLQSYVYGNNPKTASEEACYFIRVMPNMAASIGESMSVMSTSTPPPPKVLANLTIWMFEQIGKIREVSEETYGAGGVLAGAAGAFMALAFDGILDGAVVEGFKRAEAQEIMAQSLLGLAKLLQNGEHPAILREKVSSPRGTTIAGIMTLEKAAVRSSFSDAVINAAHRGRTM